MTVKHPTNGEVYGHRLTMAHAIELLLSMVAQGFRAVIEEDEECDR